MRTYKKPETEIVLPILTNVMQGFEEASGENGPTIDPDNPITDPNDPNAGLANQNPIWDTWGEEGN